MGDTFFPERVDIVALTPKRGKREKKDEVGILRTMGLSGVVHGSRSLNVREAWAIIKGRATTRYLLSVKNNSRL